VSRSDGSLLSSAELALPRFVICNKKYIKSSSLPPSVSKFYLAFGSFCVYVLMTSRSISFSFSKVLHLFSNSSKRACLSLSAFSKEFMYAFFLSLACCAETLLRNNLLSRLRSRSSSAVFPVGISGKSFVWSVGSSFFFFGGMVVVVAVDIFAKFPVVFLFFSVLVPSLLVAVT